MSAMPEISRLLPAVIAVLITLAAPARSNSAETATSGERIYRDLCSNCHGKDGEGVRGKYDEALHGDWSVEKLTRYIDKSMPDGAPEKCVGADAAAVARFIHGAFYSREARARNNPARVELVRLTNRQYVNTVADLLKGFAGNDTPPGTEHGLRGTYRDQRRGDGKPLERIDRQIAFDFLAKDADPSAGLTNEFSANWRGSIVAEESGDFEFILKTSNGARLWVNDDQEPLIDAGVASGKVDEHRATIRLLGGRAYPLRLEWFKAPKDKEASITLQWKPPFGAQQSVPARCLNPARSTPTFVVTTPFPPDDSSVGYERGVSISKAWDAATTQAAIEVANHVVKNLDRLTGTKPGSTNRAVKATAFCEEFVATAFRRPLTEEQKQMFVASQFTRAPKTDDAVKRVILRTLKSPRFLYLGLDDAKPDDFTVAARLAFGLWDSLPDRALRQAAAQGALRNREQVIKQSRRMLADPRARSKNRAFLHHWLQVDHVETLAKDDKLFPGFTPEVVADLRTSLNLFLDDVVWSDSSDYRRLLLEDDLFVNNRLAEFYRVATNAPDEFVRAALEPEQRAGVVTHPYLLAAFSYSRSTSPIHRGVFLTRNIVGRTLKPPPMAVAFKDADFSPNMTMREKVAELTRPQACQGCHSVINPLGFSLEHFDAVGRLRTREGDRPINAVSDYITDDGEKVHLTGARDVAQFAVGSEFAQEAFIEQLFHQIVKQPVLAYGPNVLDQLRESFAASGYNIQKLVIEIAALSALHQPGTPPTQANKS